MIDAHGPILTTSTALPAVVASYRRGGGMVVDSPDAHFYITDQSVIKASTASRRPSKLVPMHIRAPSLIACGL
ncbi:MAG TPA: hypothetical protein VLM87_04930, partial [Rubrivivax sp.]|nr:hypothetical protein [Rubrivivax sp.]